MADQTLQDKAIQIKGKDYVLVKDRIIYFNETYPDGSIKTSLISSPDADVVVIKAEVVPSVSSPDRSFTGYSQARWGDGYINASSALENAETSAVGRALAMMGIGVIDSVASGDEINKAESDIKPWLNEPELSDVLDGLANAKDEAKLNQISKELKVRYKLSKSTKETLRSVYESRLGELHNQNLDNQLS